MFCFVSCLPTPELGTSELNGTRELTFGQGYSVKSGYSGQVPDSEVNAGLDLLWN